MCLSSIMHGQLCRNMIESKEEYLIVTDGRYNTARATSQVLLGFFWTLSVTTGVGQSPFWMSISWPIINVGIRISLWPPLIITVGEHQNDIFNFMAGSEQRDYHIHSGDKEQMFLLLILGKNERWEDGRTDITDS